MTLVNQYNRSLETQIWNRVEDIAYRCPNTSRLLAFPIAIAAFAQSILTILASFIEESIRTIKAIRARGEQNPQNSWKTHAFQAGRFMLLTPLSPFIGLANAITKFVMIVASPLKVAKINQTLQNFDLFQEQTHYGNQPIESEFAEAAWSRFKKRVWTTQNREEVRNLQFLGDDASKTELINEVALKSLKFRESYRIVFETQGQFIQNYDNWELIDKQNMKLEKAWLSFQQQLINASYTEASTLVFVPNLA